MTTPSKEEVARRLDDFTTRVHRIAGGAAGLSAQGAASALSILVAMHLATFEQASQHLRTLTKEAGNAD